MTPHNKLRALLAAAPVPSAIDTVDKVRAFKEAHAAATRAFKSGSCTPDQAQSILKQIQKYHQPQRKKP